MSQLKDPAIKLFGKTIQLIHHHLLPKPDEEQQQPFCSGDIEKIVDDEHVTTQIEDTCSLQSAEELIDPSTSSGINDDPRTPTADKETSSKNTSKKDNNPPDNTNSEEKPQKPDKILPCPRCNSMDTKFCYYNNYNVNQPRHFCKNCQRYWTAGGTMRNTPVGSGRRKNKSSSSASYYRHLIVSEALHPCLKNNGSVLNFGSDVPLCESMNSALNFSDKSSQKSEDCSSSASNSAEKVGNNVLKNFQGYPLQVPCFSAPPWSYPWNSAQLTPNLLYPTPQYWGCTVQPTPCMPFVTPSSPLGKHSRDGKLLSPSSSSKNEEFSGDKDSENGILIPKTLRINDPNEAAKSSLWSTLGISKDEHGHIHKAFQSKSDDKSEVDATSLVNLQANPAAMSRSLNFRETS